MLNTFICGNKTEILRKILDGRLNRWENMEEMQPNCN